MNNDPKDNGNVDLPLYTWEYPEPPVMDIDEAVIINDCITAWFGKDEGPNFSFSNKYPELDEFLRSFLVEDVLEYESVKYLVARLRELRSADISLSTNGFKADGKNRFWVNSTGHTLSRIFSILKDDEDFEEIEEELRK